MYLTTIKLLIVIISIRIITVISYYCSILFLFLFLQSGQHQYGSVSQPPSYYSY